MSKPLSSAARTAEADRSTSTAKSIVRRIATTIVVGCVLGAEPAETAGTDKRKAAPAVYKDEARDINLLNSASPGGYQRRHPEKPVTVSEYERRILDGLVGPFATGLPAPGQMPECQVFAKDFPF